MASLDETPIGYNERTRAPHVIASKDERMVFSVASGNRKTPGKRYRVDLLANGGWGMCSCANWSIAAWPAIRDRRGPILTRQTTCKHVRAALYTFVADLLPKMSAKENRE